MEIRHADARRDADACAAIYAPYVERTAISFEDQAPTAADFAERIERVEVTHPFLVAATQDSIVGYAYASPHRDRAAYRWAADVAVYVSWEHRRRGVGHALYGGLLPLLVRQGLQVVCAGITLPNEPSVALHESCGFSAVGIYRRIGWKGGKWRDVGWWQLELTHPRDGKPHEPGPPARLDSPVISPS